MDMDLFLLNKLAQLKGTGGSTQTADNSALLDSTDRWEPTVSTNPVYSVFSMVPRTAAISSTEAYWSSTLSSNGTYQPANTSYQSRHFWGASSALNMHPTTTAAAKQNSPWHKNSTLDYGLQFASSMDDMVYIDVHDATGSYSTTYPPMAFRIMFVRNNTDASLTKTFYTRSSVQASNAYSYSGLYQYTPNAANFSEVTDVSGSLINSYTSGNNEINQSHSVTIPAKTTIALVAMSTFYQYTGIYNGSNGETVNGFYNLDAAFNADPSTDISCDPKATLMYMQYTDFDLSTTDSANTDLSHIVRFFNKVGEIYGDNE